MVPGDLTTRERTGARIKPSRASRRPMRAPSVPLYDPRILPHRVHAGVGGLRFTASEPAGGWRPRRPVSTHPALRAASLRAASLRAARPSPPLSDPASATAAPTVASSSPVPVSARPAGDSWIPVSSVHAAEEARATVTGPVRVAPARATPNDPVNAWLLSHLVAGLWLVGSLAVSGVVAVLALPALMRTAAESALASQAWLAVNQGVMLDPSVVGAVQIGAYGQVTGAFGRWDTVVLGAREAMVFATLLAAVLVWFIARRARIGAPAAAVAVFVFAASPAALDVHRAVSVETIGLPWVLAAVLLATVRRARAAAFVGSAVALTIGGLTAPWLLLAAPVVVVVMVLSSRGRRGAVPLVFGIGMLAVGAVAVIGLPVATGAGIPLDDALPALLALLLPATALLLAAIVDAVARVVRGRVGRAGALGLVGAVAAGVVATAVLWWMPRADLLGPAPVDARAAAGVWLVDNLTGSEAIVVDETMRADLIVDGWEASAVTTYPVGAPPEQVGDAEFAVVPDGSPVAGTTVAMFGDTTIQRIDPDGAEAALATATAASVARERTGAEVALNPGLVLDDDARALLAAGRVDARIAIVLAALAADAPVDIVGFPIIPGEEDLPVRQVALVTARGEELARADRPTSAGDDLVDDLTGEFAPDRVSAVDGALVLRYPLPTPTP